jgi:NAD-dependent DNA ligase
MSKLQEFLNLASRSYYAGEPIISDETFDRLAESAQYDEVGASGYGTKVKHVYQMFSLQKYYEGEGNRPELGSKDVDSSPKLDGAAVALTYLKGALSRAATRGDGIEGQDVTDKFLATGLVPHEIIRRPNYLPDVLQITGELCAPKHVENARNYAAGALNLKDVAEFKTRSVEFFAYGVQESLTSTFRGDMRELSFMGFNTVKDPELHNIYPMDGIVHRLNNNSEFYAAGYTAKHPRGAYALKERGSTVETKLLDVVWQVGKTGKVTPVALLEPVLVGDAMVSRATLNNIAFIRALEISIGDTVGIVRAGEIVPQVVHKVV